MAQTLSMEDVVASAMDVALQNVWTSMPGRVESYDPIGPKINVRIAIKSPTVGEDGAPNVQSIAVLTSVPVIFPGGSSFRFVAPLQAGDTVLLVVCSRSIDKWLLKGGIVDPGFTQKHHISDAVAIPILRDFAHPLKNSPSDHASIGHDEGATIEFRPDELRLGSDSASKAVAVQSALDDFISALDATSSILGAAGAAGIPGKLAIDTLKGCLAALPITGTPTSIPSPGAGWLAGTTKVKAE